MRNKKIIILLALSLVGTVALAARPYFNSEEEAKIATFVLKALEDSSKIPVIIKMKKQADLKAIDQANLPLAERKIQVYDALRLLALEDQKDIVQLLQTRGTKFRRFYISNMIAVWNADAALVKTLAARQDVAKIYGNPSVSLNLPSQAERVALGIRSLTDSNDALGDNITFTGADKIWEKYGKAGEGIVVAGQDTGVQYDHPALLKQYRGYQEGVATSHDYNWHDSIHKDTPVDSNRCGYDLETPCDDGDHGSHTMGTIVGSDGDKNVIGMAPKAKWVACRNMDGGAGTPATYIECFEWLLAPYKFGANPMTDANPALAPNIINNSWGCPESEGCSADEIAPSLEAMKAAGILVVVSAGNDGPDCSTIQDPPAWHSALTLSVGAYDHRRKQIASFSSRGPSKIDGEIGPDVVAPGVNIRSSVPGSGYAQFGWSGTSMAGPHVAGAAALLWSIRPELIGKIEKTMEIMKKSAVATVSDETCGGVSGSSIPNNTFGMGVIDIAKAISFAEGTSTPEEKPSDNPTTPTKKPRSMWPSANRAK
jgi:serine protease AprX